MILGWLTPPRFLLLFDKFLINVNLVFSLQTFEFYGTVVHNATSECHVKIPRRNVTSCHVKIPT